MTSNTIRPARQHAIERQIKRLERKLAVLQVVSNRVSWVRAGVFVLTLIVGFGIGTRLNESVGWVTLAVGLALFVAVVVYHRHLERWVQTFTIWRDIRSDQLARMSLCWEKLPKPASFDGQPKSPIALDLDLIGQRSLHHLLDTTVSRQGSQLLADWVTQTDPVPERVDARQCIVRELVPLSRFRDRFRLTFRLVLQEQLEGENLLYWLSVEFPSRRLRWMLPVATVLVAINLILFGLYTLSGWPALWAISLVLYAAFYFFNQGSLGTVFGAVVRLDAELDRFSAILRYLERFPYTGHPHLAALCASLIDAHHAPSAEIRKIKVASAGVGLRSNPVLGLLLNLVLPWDFFFAYLADHYRGEVAELFPVWAQVCYQLDAFIALANFAYLNPEYAFPEITLNSRPIFRAQDMGHPLIPYGQNVRNDFSIETPGQVAIITGSNMAGKSTFIKTVGINLCLAYAGGPVDATHFHSAPFRLHTCIRITDSITDGFSYFYAEVRCLKRLLEELKATSPLPLLYLIDEIFRGTNNRERLLGSRAYIRALLGENGAGLLATHDLELAGLAESNPQRVHNYHFRDQVLDGKLVFDYRIRPGASPTTNALKIMEMEGLPVESA